MPSIQKLAHRVSAIAAKGLSGASQAKLEFLARFAQALFDSRQVLHWNRCKLLQVSAVALRVDHWASASLPGVPRSKAGSALNSLQRVSPCREPRYTKPLSRGIVLLTTATGYHRTNCNQGVKSSLTVTVRPCTEPEPGLAPSSQPSKSRVKSVRSMWRIRCVT